MIQLNGYYRADVGNGFTHVLRFYKDGVLVGYTHPGPSVPIELFARALLPSDPTLPKGTYSFKDSELNYLIEDFGGAGYNFVGFELDDRSSIAGVRTERATSVSQEITYEFVPFANDDGQVDEVLNSEFVS